MIDTSRRYLLRAAHSPHELATILLERSWPICSALLLEELVFVHAGTSDEAAAAYYVVRLGEGWPLHVPTVELVRHDETSLQSVIEKLVVSDFDPDSPPIDGVLWLDTLDDHVCPFCS